MNNKEELSEEKTKEEVYLSSLKDYLRPYHEIYIGLNEIGPPTSHRINTVLQEHPRIIELNDLYPNAKKIRTLHILVKVLKAGNGSWLDDFVEACNRVAKALKE